MKVDATAELERWKHSGLTASGKAGHDAAQMGYGPEEPDASGYSESVPAKASRTATGPQARVSSSADSEPDFTAGTVMGDTPSVHRLSRGESLPPQGESDE